MSLILPVGIPALWLITLILILKAEFNNSTEKLIWVLLSFVPIIGPILYFVIGRKQHQKN